MHLSEDDEPTDPIPARRVNQAISAELEEASTDEIPAKMVTTVLANGPRPNEDRTDPDLHRAAIDFAPREHDPDETLRISTRKG